MGITEQDDGGCFGSVRKVQQNTMFNMCWNRKVYICWHIEHVDVKCLIEVGGVATELSKFRATKL